MAALLLDRCADDRVDSLLQLRHDLRLPHAVVVAAGERVQLPGLGRAMRARIARSVLVTAIDDMPPHVTLVVPVESPTVLRAARQAVEEQAQRRDAVAVVERAVIGPRALRARYHRAVCKVALALHVGLPGPIIQLSELVLPRAFGQLDAEEQEVLLRPLAAILALPPASRDDYLRTIDVLRRTADYAEAARLLHLHPNTVRYRAERIQDMTGVCLARPDQRQSLDIAVILHFFLRGTKWMRGAAATSPSRSVRHFARPDADATQQPETYDAAP